MKAPSGMARATVTAMVKRISPQPARVHLLDVLVFFFLFSGLKSVGAQQRGDHVDADRQCGGGVDELDDHGQILRRATA